MRLILPYVTGEGDAAHLERGLGVPFPAAIRRWGDVGRIEVRLHEEAARLLGSAPG